MKLFWIAFIWAMPLMAQESIDVKYLVRFNDDLFGGRRDRLHDGYLKIRGDKSVSYLVAKEAYKPKSEFDRMMSNDTMFYVYTDLRERSLIFQDYDFMGKVFWVSDSLHPMLWNIHTEQKKIGDFECKKATATFRGRNYSAWFASEIPIPLGPWKMGGLPGLILEIEDDGQNMVVKLQSIVNDKQKNELILPVANMNWETSTGKKKKFFEKLKSAKRANGDPDCISCQSDSKVSISSWEKF